MSYQIRWLIRRDMPSVLDIENQSFDTPWNEENFLQVLRQRSCIGMVAVDNKCRILAFMVYELHQSMIQVLDFAVHPDHRLQGVGKSMIARVKDKLSQQRRREIMLAIRETNLDAQLFFSKQDFRAERVIENYYENTNEAAYIFRYQLERTDNDFAPGLAPKNRISNYIEDGA